MRSTRECWALVMVVFLLVAVMIGLAGCDWFGGGPEVLPAATPLAGSGATNLSGLDIDTDDGSTIAALSVASHGTGNVAEFYDGANAAMVIADGGAATFYYGLTGTDLTVSGDLGVDDTFNIDDTTYVLTGTQTLTPTASYYAINASAAVTVTLGDASNGDLLILANLTTNNAIVADSNIRTTTGGALTLGQYDVILLLFTGTEWYQLAAQASNS